LGGLSTRSDGSGDVAKNRQPPQRCIGQTDADETEVRANLVCSRAVVVKATKQDSNWNEIMQVVFTHH